MITKDGKLLAFENFVIDRELAVMAIKDLDDSRKR